MKIARKWTLMLALVLACAAAVQAQEKARPVLTPLKIQVVFSEYEGEKKVSSIPYSLLLNSPDAGRSDVGKIRVGVRVPLVIQAKEGLQTQYQNVGTDIDVSAQTQPSGSFKVGFSIRRSFIYSPPSPGAKTEEPDMSPPRNLQPTPIFRDFFSEFDLLLKDGQTLQSALATDPVSGRVLKVDVTLAVVK